ncbi:MAG: prepilin-type N-terminal cleavage/methylation domain-containing protein [Candidatus Eremiobacteraeota bacterium]|nr:prepilin-type N-terminal cleavage/methylation domain-containing protein [Candidatus Eremiobacteraeota bacterium]
MPGKRKHNGFTLVELMVAMFLLVIFNLSIIQLLKGGILVWRKSKIIGELERNANDAFNHIATDYSFCYAQIVPPPGDTSESSTFQFNRYDKDGNPGYSVRYYYDPNTQTLVREVTPPGGDPVEFVVADNVMQAPTFQRDPNDPACFNVRISFLYDPYGQGEDIVLGNDPSIKTSAKWALSYGPWRKFQACARISARCDTADIYPNYTSNSNSGAGSDIASRRVQGYVQISDAGSVDIPPFIPLMDVKF